MGVLGAFRSAELFSSASKADPESVVEASSNLSEGDETAPGEEPTAGGDVVVVVVAAVA